MDKGKPLSPFQKYNCIAGYHLLFFHPCLPASKLKKTFLKDAWIIEFLKEKTSFEKRILLSSPLLDGNLFKIKIKHTIVKVRLGIFF